MSIIAKRSRLRKLSKVLYDYPDPLRSQEDFDRLLHLDLPDMDPTALKSERQRVLLALAMTGDEILYLDPAGGIITAEGWLGKRLQLIDRALRGAVD